MPERPGVAGPNQTARMPAFGGALHARTSAGRADGFLRRRLRRLLPVSQPASGDIGGGALNHERGQPNSRRSARFPFRNIRTSCWRTAAAAS